MKNEQTVFIVDDDEGVRDGLSLLLATVGQHSELFLDAIYLLQRCLERQGQELHDVGQRLLVKGLL